MKKLLKKLYRDLMKFYTKDTYARLFFTGCFGYALITAYQNEIVEFLSKMVILFALVVVAIPFFYFISKIIKIRLARINFDRNKRLDIIDKFSGEEFEEFLMRLFATKGYSVNGTPKSGDFGVDIILDSGKEKIAVQAKRYNGSVGVKAVQEVIAGMSFYKCNFGLVVTNSYFTPSARKLANSARVELWDRAKLANELSSIEFSAIENDVVLAKD